jgi:small-conductance mechanosensitive channel
VERVTKEVIWETLQEVEGAVKDFEPVIRIYAFGESRINLRAILRVTEYAYQFAVKHEFIKRIQKRYQQEGISIPFPVHTVVMKNNEA